MKSEMQNAVREIISHITVQALDGEFDMDDTPKFTDEELEKDPFSQKYNETILFLMKVVKLDYDEICREMEEDEIACNKEQAELSKGDGI